MMLQFESKFNLHISVSNFKHNNPTNYMEPIIYKNNGNEARQKRNERASSELTLTNLYMIAGGELN